MLCKPATAVRRISASAPADKTFLAQVLNSHNNNDNGDNGDNNNNNDITLDINHNNSNIHNNS
jgi:hypothetical protein